MYGLYCRGYYIATEYCDIGLL